MARIKIEDLPILKELSKKEAKGIFGGSLIGTGITSIRVSIQQTTQRQTSKTDFGSILKEGLATTSDVALGAGQLAAPYIPGGSVVTAAVSGVRNKSDDLGDSAGS